MLRLAADAGQVDAGSLFLLPLARERQAVIYDAKPFVGVESPIVIMGRAYLVPGIRLHGLDDGWLIRPSVGIGWNF